MNSQTEKQIVQKSSWSPDSTIDVGAMIGIVVSILLITFISFYRKEKRK